MMLAPDLICDFSPRNNTLSCPKNSFGCSLRHRSPHQPDDKYWPIKKNNKKKTILNYKIMYFNIKLTAQFH